MLLALLALLAVGATPSPAPLPDHCQAADSFVGTICTPTSLGKHPAILLLGGSEGGDSMPRFAAHFTDQGYVAATVAYFRAPGLPRSLENIPVETIGNAVAAVAKRDDVDPQRIAVLGISRGGELALLVAANDPVIRAVVADVPSPFAWQGIAAGAYAAQGPWTQEGKPLPYVPVDPSVGEAYMNALANGTSLALRPYQDVSLKEKAVVDAAFFPLERAHGPIMLLAGDDDQVWNSPAQCELAIAYLRAHHHAYADVYLHYPGAGHTFLSANMPPLQRPLAPHRVKFLVGGTPEANRAAAEQAWKSIDAFLSAALKAPAGPG